MANRNGGFIGTDGLDAPDPPTGVTPTAGDAQVSVAFTAPTDTGTSAITGFVAQVSTDGTAYSAGSNTGTSSPIVVSSLSNGTSYTAKVWAINAYGTSAPSDASSGVAPAAPTGLFGGGKIGGDRINVIQQITIGTTGDSTDFGDLSVTRDQLAGCSSASRGVFGGGYSGSNSDVMDYVTITSSGNATDFGNLLTGTLQLAACSSSTRGLFSGGDTSGGTVDVIQYITIASTGNATDFGNLLATTRLHAGCSSNTRGIFGGAEGAAITDVIQYVTIASTGNATDFGNLSVAR